jgi:hypothetical protein
MIAPASVGVAVKGVLTDQNRKDNAETQSEQRIRRESVPPPPFFCKCCI